MVGGSGHRGGGWIQIRPGLARFERRFGDEIEQEP